MLEFVQAPTSTVQLMHDLVPPVTCKEVVYANGEMKNGRVVGTGGIHMSSEDMWACKIYVAHQGIADCCKLASPSCRRLYKRERKKVIWPTNVQIKQAYQ